MGGHHKKHLRAEKAKVKLKGAKLPKGLNVTKTDFKVRKIEIREQLKESLTSTPSGQRELNLKEVLSRLKHHNLKFRTDALRNVRDVIKSGRGDHLIGHLNELLQGIAGGALDMELDVRRECFKTLDALLDGLPANTILPFFHIIAAYLRCAMTHVQPAIQEDSLLMLDVLLERVPSHLLAERIASTIIINFINMISRMRHDTQHTNRLLTVRIDQSNGQGSGQQTTITWRSKVLLRLQKILSTLLKKTDSTHKHAPKVPRVIYYDVTKPQYYNVLCPLQVDSRDLYTILGDRMRKAENEQLHGYVEELIPLLQDSWIEVQPQQQDQLLSADAASNLYVILDIMTQLWQLVLQYEGAQQNNTRELSDWMRHTYASNFMRTFLKDNSFPYQQQPQQATAIQNTSKHSKKRKASAADGELCIVQNLCLVQLVCHFWPQPNSEQSDYYGTLLHYINQCLRQLTTLRTNEQLRLVTVLRVLLLDNGMALLGIQAHKMGMVMKSCIDAYTDHQYTTRDGVATKMLNLLCQIIQSEELYNGYGGEDQFAKLLEYLPELLLKPSIADGTLIAMSTLCRQQNVVFMKSLLMRTSDILSNIKRLHVTGDDDTESRFEQQKRVLNLFYHSRDCGDGFQVETALKVLEEEASEHVTNYLRSIFKFD